MSKREDMGVGVSKSWAGDTKEEVVGVGVRKRWAGDGERKLVVKGECGRVGDN